MSIPWIAEVIPLPTVEPISVDQARLYCRIDDASTEENEYIASLITAARLTVEKHTGRMLIPQTWKTLRSYWPRERYITFPTAPVTRIVSVAYQTISGDPPVPTTNEMPAEDYDLLTYPNRLPILYAKNGWPAAQLSYPGLAVTFDCGYPAVPEDLLEAVRSLIAYWYDNREAAIASTQYKAEVLALPLRYQTLIAPYTLRRI